MKLAFSLLLPVVLSVGAFAGDPETVLRVGDFVTGLGTVTSLESRVAVDEAGRWWVVANSGATKALLHNGSVVLRTGDAVSNPSGATITAIRSFAVHGLGQPVWTVGLSIGGDAVYVSGALALRTGTPTLTATWPPGSQWPSGTTYASFRHAQRNANNQFLLMGSVSDPTQGTVDFVSVVNVNGSGTATSESIRVRVGGVMGSQVIDSVPVRPEQAVLDDTGRVVLTVSAAGGQSRVITVSPTCTNLGAPCSILLSQFAPGPTGESLGDLLGAAVGSNSPGHWTAKVRAGSTNSVRICANLGAATTQLYAEGATLAGITPWTIQSILFDGPLFLPDTGPILWYGRWNEPATSRDEGIFRGTALVVQEGVTLSDAGVIQSLDPYGFAIGRGGRHLVFRGRLAGSVDAVFHLDLNPPTAFCFGDGSGTACPCGNSTPAGQGRGCRNSFGTGALHSVTGVASISADTITLHVVDTSPTGQAPTFFQGTSQAGGGLGTVFGDGLRCAVGTTVRLGTRVSVNGAVDFGYGVPGDPLVHVQGLVSSGAVRHYQVLYRNAAAFCTASTFNTSNGLTITWGP